MHGKGVATLYQPDESGMARCGSTMPACRMEPQRFCKRAGNTTPTQVRFCGAAFDRASFAPNPCCLHGSLAPFGTFFCRALGLDCRVLDMWVTEHDARRRANRPKITASLFAMGQNPSTAIGESQCILIFATLWLADRTRRCPIAVIPTSAQRGRDGMCVTHVTQPVFDGLQAMRSHRFRAMRRSAFPTLQASGIRSDPSMHKGSSAKALCGPPPLDDATIYRTSLILSIWPQRDFRGSHGEGIASAFRVYVRGSEENSPPKPILSYCKSASVTAATAASAGPFKAVALQPKASKTRRKAGVNAPDKPSGLSE